LVKPRFGSLSPNAPPEPSRPGTVASRRHAHGGCVAIAVRFACPAARKPLESVARPLDAVE